MLPSPVPADPGWDEDLAWLDRDPEREVWLARAREHDEPPGEDEDDRYFEPLTAEELAGIDEAAADELLAVKAASTGRRGPAQPGSARTFPGESASPAASFGPGTPRTPRPLPGRGPARRDPRPTRGPREPVTGAWATTVRKKDCSIEHDTVKRS